jgi:DNA-binding response OmpR family regulator
VTDDSLPEAYLALTTESGQREVHRVDRPVTTLGRGVGCDLLLTSPQVSRRHAELRWDGEHFVVVDLGSTNGTRINGASVGAAALIGDGDYLEVADIRLQFHLSASTVTLSVEAMVSPLSVDLARHEVRLRGDLLALTPKEYRLIAFLYGRDGAVATSEEIASEVWPELDGAVSDDSITQVVARLRRKVEDDPGDPRFILTVRGFGYRLAATPEGSH